MSDACIILIIYLIGIPITFGIVMVGASGDNVTPFKWWQPLLLCIFWPILILIIFGAILISV